MQIQIEGHTRSLLTNNPQSVKVTSNRGSLETVTATRSLRKHKPLNLMWYPEEDPGTEKEYYGRTSGILVKCEA